MATTLRDDTVGVSTALSVMSVIQSERPTLSTCDTCEYCIVKVLFSGDVQIQIEFYSDLHSFLHAIHVLTLGVANAKLSSAHVLTDFRGHF